MNQPKDYDSTLARIAGNVASGICASNGQIIHDDGGLAADIIASQSMDIADRILAACREDAKKQGQV